MEHETLEIESVEDARAFVAKKPHHRISLAWQQMLEEMDDYGEEFTVDDFIQEAEYHIFKGHL